jgi:predicted glycogen debranching enzyme
VNTGEFTREPEWRYMVGRPLEAERGLDPDSDLFSPGYFTIPLRAGQTVELLAQILTPQEPDELPFLPAAVAAPPDADPDPVFPEREPLLDTLGRALRHYVVRRGSLKTVIAGYPWFLDWGRDTLICARGLIAAGLHDDVMAILRQFAHFEQDGTLPNMIRGDDASNRDTSDAPLWFFTACADLSNALHDTDWLDDAAGGRPVRDALLSIARACSKATPNGIAMDSKTGLLFSPAHFTWMDTNFPAGTPRRGYPIEIQALWYAALRFLCRLGESEPWSSLAARVADAIARLYWLPGQKYLSDCLHAEPGVGATAAKPDDALRPNQLLALTLGAVRDPLQARSVLDACADLLVPGAIRTLADRPVEYPLPIRRDGTLLNDPARPYWGTYQGDEDTRRKPAYHNGTAWTWLFPSYSEAFALVHGEAGKPTALALLESSRAILNAGCLGQIPEILDGDAPHKPRGCDAQAWGVTELYRVLKLLT